MAALAILVLLCAPAGAQTPPDFSGHWVLNKAKSKEHRPDQFKDRRMEVVHSEPDLSVTIRDERPNGGEFRAYLDFKTDGTPTESFLGAPQQAVARWEGSKLVIRWNMDSRTRQKPTSAPGSRGATPPFIWTWSLSADTNTLTNEIRVFQDVKGEITESLVFTRAQ